MNVKDLFLKDMVVILYKGYVVFWLKMENLGIFFIFELYLFFYLCIFYMKIILKMLDIYLIFFLKKFEIVFFK